MLPTSQLAQARVAPLTMNLASRALLEPRRWRPGQPKGYEEANAVSGLRIVGVERLKKSIGFPPYAFRKRFVSHGVFARRLKFSPQALNAGQTLAAVI